MRVIGGELSGRRFYPPADKWPTRPTTDYAKEGLFNILNNYLSFPDTKFLDLFGGTGSHSYEFASRGCTDVTYVDKHYPCVKFVKTTIGELKIQEYVKTIKSDVFRFLKADHSTYDYIFAGPPYPLPNIPEIPDLIFERPRLNDKGFFVMEHNPNHTFKDHPCFWMERNYGKTIFTFFETKPG